MRVIMKSDDEKRIIDFYESRLRKYDRTPQAVDYGNAESQLVRFRVLAQFYHIFRYTILDIGCGMGDLYKFFQETFGNNFVYYGIDISEAMIGICKERFSDGNFSVRNFAHADFDEKFDLIYVSGTLDFKSSGGIDYIKESISKMYSLSRLGVAFNLTSMYTEAKFRNSWTYYADPAEVFIFCKSFCPYVSLRHDYAPNDFTVYLYKNRELERQ